MDSLDEPDAQSFIIKIWVEDSAEKNGRGVWHGHITHVPDHERHYLKNLDDIQGFIAPHLEAMGIKPGKCWQLKNWLKHLMERS